MYLNTFNKLIDSCISKNDTLQRIYDNVNKVRMADSSVLIVNVKVQTTAIIITK